MSPANDKHQAPTNGLKLDVRVIIKSKGYPTVVQLKRKPKLSTVIGFTARKCRLSHDIHVVSDSFITFDNTFKLITQIRLSNNSFKSFFLFVALSFNALIFPILRIVCTISFYYITCWERADLLALVCGVFCEFVTFPLVSWVRCGT